MLSNFTKSGYLPIIKQIANWINSNFDTYMDLQFDYAVHSLFTHNIILKSNKTLLESQHMLIKIL